MFSGTGGENSDNDVPSSLPEEPVILTFERIIRDPVQGDIRLTKWENEIIDNPAFQRLRHIRQLGMVYLVYPGALHTRFEHSLGTLEEAQRIIEAINSFPSADKDQIRLNAEEVKLARLCALLHDVSHIPFGHSIEDELGVLDPHDDGEQTIRDALYPFKDIIDRYSMEEGGGTLNYEQVVACLAGTATGKARAIAEIVSGTVSADLRDYLKRDYHFTGIPYRLDERLLRYFYISATPVRTDRGAQQEYHLTIELDKKGAIRRDIVSDMLYLLRLRYFLGERVYYHPTKIAASTMIARAVQEVFPRARRKDLMDLKGPLHGFGDDELIRYLLDLKHPVATPLACALRNRALHKPCWALLDTREDLRKEIIAHFADPDARRKWEDRAAEYLGGRPGQVLVYCAPEGMSFKHANILVHTGYSILPFRECPKVFGVGDAIKSLETDHRNLWCFYVFIDPKLVHSREDNYQHLEYQLRAQLESELKLGIPGAHLPNQLQQYKKDRLARLIGTPHDGGNC